MNHPEILAIHEASRECVWLRSMPHHIQETCGLSFNKNLPTLIFEDNTACIAQIKGVYIKGDRTKHISPKLFYPHDLEENGASVFNKFLQRTTWWTYSQRHYSHQHLKS